MTRRSIAVVALVAALLLAGCAGPGGGTGDGGGATTTTGPPERSAEEVRDDAVAAIAGVDTYRASAENEVVVTGNLRQRSRQSVTGVFDREARELQIDRVARAAGRTQRSSTWLVDRTIYSRSDVYTRQFGSRWIRADASENFSRLWRVQDSMTRQRAVLENASTLELAGTATVNGTEAYVLHANVTPGDYEEMAGGLFGSALQSELDVTIHRADFTFYVGTETDLPVRTEGQVNATVPVRGRTIDQNVSISIDYYGYDDPVSISLPDAADSAVDVGNRTSGALVAGGEQGASTGRLVPGQSAEGIRTPTVPPRLAAGVAPTTGHGAPVTQP